MRFVKKFFGVILCICALGFISATAQVEPKMRPYFIVLVCLCIVGAVLLLKGPKKHKRQAPPPQEAQGEFVTVQTEYTPSEVPADIAAEMKKYYTVAQAQRDMEIMADSYKIASTTVNLETFCTRYELALQKAHTLLQAEQVGVRGMKKLKFHDACIAIINAAPSLKVRALHDYAESATSQADWLKTDRGKYNRYIKILAELEKAEPTFMFMDEYENMLDEIKEHISKLKDTQPTPK